MVDTDAVLRSFLIQNPGVTGLAGKRIFAGVNPPPGYKPADGPALVFSIRGGLPDYSNLMLAPSYQFRCIAITLAEARTLDRALYEALQDKSGIGVKIARMEAIGQPLTEPSTGWPFVLSYYRIFFNNQ